MKLAYTKPNTTAFGAVVTGGTFIWDNRVYMKLREYREYNCVDLESAKLYKLEVESRVMLVEGEFSYSAKK
jgi:hypothetical protein